MAKNPEKSTQVTFDLNGAISTPKVIYRNTDEELIVISKDKLELHLKDSVDRISKRDRWRGPLGALVPIALTVFTSTFTNRFGIGGGEWETIFILLGLLALGWLAYAFKQRGGPVTAQSIVEKLTKDPVTIKSSPVSEVWSLDKRTGNVRLWPKPVTNGETRR